MSKDVGLGKKLENPYSVANMRKAVANLKVSNSGGRIASEEIEIATTHLYIKFKPKDENQLSMLKRDSTLILYEYPLDYEILNIGNSYHDPTVPVDQPTYQYASVEVAKKLPAGVEYELLDELFIPDERKDQPSSNGRMASNETIDTREFRQAVGGQPEL